jgi:probable HAF family extracellular repeat protein
MKTTALLASVSATLIFATAVSGKPYAIREIDGSSNLNDQRATAINDRGDVVGYSYDHRRDERVGYIYSVSKPGRVSYLNFRVGTPVIKDILPYGIDPTGKYIVGMSRFQGGDYEAFLYQITVGNSGILTQLPTPPMSGDSVAYGVNWTANFGLTIVGSSYPSAGALQTEATRWTGDDPSIRQGQGGLSLQARGLNKAGAFVGQKQLLNGDLIGFVNFYGSGIVDLPSLGGNATSPTAINDANLVVGHSRLPGNNRYHAFLVKAGDPALLDLGTLAPAAAVNSEALAINRHGSVVGWSEFQGDNDERRAFLYEKGRMVDLNTLLPPGSPWVLTEATGINQHGQIVGTGILYGHTAGFLMTPPLSFAVAGGKSLVVPENLKRLTLSGKGSTSLSGVTYRVGNRGKFLKARGTLRWRFTARLAPGPNLIYIVANSPGVSSKPTKIRIRRR